MNVSSPSTYFFNFQVRAEAEAFTDPVDSKR